MPTELSYKHKFEHHPDSERAIMLLHGARGGIHSSFMRALWKRFSPVETCLAIEFPFISDDEAERPTRDLSDEVDAVQAGLEFLKNEGVLHTHIIAKSLGGVVASRWLNRESSKKHDVGLSILGFVIGDVETHNLHGNLSVVVQGSEDRFGNAADVKARLARAHVDAHVFGIPGADHSFRTIPEDNSDSLRLQAIEIVAEQLKISQPQ